MSRLEVVILTKNEEAHIEDVLSSLDGLDCNILIVDSGSTDKTLEICEKYGAEIVFYEYVTEAKTRNWVLTERADVDWILFLDADERLTPELNLELRELPDPSDGVVGFYIRREMWFLGRPLRFGGHQNNYLLHLLHPPVSQVIEQTRTLEYVDVKGRTGRLKHHMIHENKKPLRDWVVKHDFYAQREAEDRRSGVKRDKSVTEGRSRAFIHKHLLSRLPPLLLPFAFFVYRYFLRLGFLDGRVGFIYYVMHDFWYPTLIAAKLVELDVYPAGDDDRS